MSAAGRGGRRLLPALLSATLLFAILTLAGLLSLAGMPAAGGATAAADDADPFALFDPAERAAILAHGPWPPAPGPGPGNRASGDPAAIALGRRLFASAALAGGRDLACADCHRPDAGFADGRAVALGRDGDGNPVPLERNTPSLLDAGFHRWFGWDGASDSLWAASLRALTSAREMAASAEDVQTVLAGDPGLAAGFRAAFGRLPGEMPAEEVMVLAAKALAAFQETLVSPRTAFDAFRDALAAGDVVAGRAYPAAARRGLKLFVGRGGCSPCHFGPLFSNGEFADIGIPFFLPGPDGRPAGADRGRYGGIQALRTSRFNLLGPYSDGGADEGWATAAVAEEHRNFGAFRVPGLRGLAATAPYMHNGSLASLEDVVRHYSELDMERLHSDGEALLRPLHLTPAEQDDLLAFLRSLSEPEPEPEPAAAGGAGQAD